MDLQRWHLHADHRFHAQRTLTGVAVAILLASATASAQISVEVSPLRVELQAAPGATTTQAITVTNGGKEPIRVRAIVTDWDLSRDGAPQFEGVAEGGRYSATAWVRVAPPEQVIAPAKDATVRFSLSVPQGVEPAGYRTGVLFEFGPATGDPVARAREVQFKSRIATLIYVNVGQPPAALELMDLTQRVVGGEPRVIAVLKNTSRRTIRTKGTLTIYDKNGTALRELPVPDAPVLPESERELAMPLTGGAHTAALPAGEYRVEVKIDAGLPALIVGETTIKLDASAPAQVPK
jgi:P pilus assembly chaperone PapD